MVSHKLDFFTALKEPPSSLLQDNGKALLFLGPYAFTSRCYSVLKDRLQHGQAPREPHFLPHQARISQGLFTAPLPFLGKTALASRAVKRSGGQGVKSEIGVNDFKMIAF